MLRPTLKLVKASWASTWAKYMRIILDKLPHGRNIAKGQGEDALIPPCPLCQDDEDSLEHLTACSYGIVSDSRRRLFQDIDEKLMTFCTSQDFPDEVLLLSRAYITACASTTLPTIDILGGWTGIPLPRFISLFHPNIHISEQVAAGLRLTLPRIIADCLDWLHSIWRKRCSIIHGLSSSATPSNTPDSVSFTSSSTATLASPLQATAASQPRRWQRRRKRTASKRTTSHVTQSPSNSQGSLDTFVSLANPIGDPAIPIRTVGSSPLDLPSPQEENIVQESIFNYQPTMQSMQSTVLIADLAPQPALQVRPTTRRVTRSIHNLLDWNFRSRRDILDRYLSSEHATPLAPSCANLVGHFTRVLPTNHYFLPYPHHGYIGQSKILGAGLGLFLETEPPPLREGSVVGEYWGPSTTNGGIDPIYLTSDRDPPGRDDGAYLLQHADAYIVDAHKDCAVGYLNDPFEEANCFFQVNPDNPEQILVVTRVVFPGRGVYELTVNYGWDYWRERLHLLSPSAQARCLAFYCPDM